MTAIATSAATTYDRISHCNAIIPPSSSSSSSSRSLFPIRFVTRRKEITHRQTFSPIVKLDGSIIDLTGIKKR